MGKLFLSVIIITLISYLMLFGTRVEVTKDTTIEKHYPIISYKTCKNFFLMSCLSGYNKVITEHYLNTPIIFYDVDNETRDRIMSIVKDVRPEYLKNTKSLNFINRWINGASGFYTTKDKKVIISTPDKNINQYDDMFKMTLCHEIAHTLLHNYNSDMVDNGVLKHEDIYALGGIIFCLKSEKPDWDWIEPPVIKAIENETGLDLVGD